MQTLREKYQSLPFGDRSEPSGVLRVWSNFPFHIGFVFRNGFLLLVKMAAVAVVGVSFMESVVKPDPDAVFLLTSSTFRTSLIVVSDDEDEDVGPTVMESSEMLKLHVALFPEGSVAT